MKKLSLLLLLTPLLLLTACSKALLPVLGTSEFTAAPIPSATSSATPEPTPTPTLQPTPTAEPTPTPSLAEQLHQLKVAYFTEHNEDGLTAEEIEALARSLYVDPDRPMIALTFDDGPAITATTMVLDVLEAYGVRATFFVIGNRAERYPELVQRELSLYCEVGGHSYAHYTPYTELSYEKLYEDMQKTIDAISEATGGYRIRLYRPPGGAVSNNVLVAALDQDLAVINWSTSTADWQKENAGQIITQFRCLAHDDQIVLLHDLRYRTGVATKTIVSDLVKAGYQLVTVSELLFLSGYLPESGTLYAVPANGPKATACPSPTPLPSPTLNPKWIVG